MWNEKPDNFIPNDAGGIVLTITSSDLEAPLVVDGLEMVELEMDEDDFTMSSVASGMKTMNRIRSTSGVLRFEVSDSSPSMNVLNTLIALKKAVAFTFTDPVTPDLNCSSSYCFFRKRPNIMRGRETNNSTFEITAPVMKAATGGFQIVT